MSRAGEAPTAADRETVARLLGREPRSAYTVAVRGADGASWNNKRLDFVAFSFQVRYAVVEPHSHEPANIFANNPTGPGG